MKLIGMNRGIDGQADTLTKMYQLCVTRLRERFLCLAHADTLIPAVFSSQLRLHWLTKQKKLAGAWDILTNSFCLEVTDS